MHRSPRLQLRNGNADEWAAKNPVLMEGEPGFERDTGQLKIGNGLDKWNDLPYQVGDSPGPPPSESDLDAHIHSTLPHPVYDDGPSLALIYQNAKV